MVMSALPPKPDMCSATAHVCFGPEADTNIIRSTYRRDLWLLITVLIVSAPRIRIIGHFVVTHRSSFVTSFGNPAWIVKLIGDAKSTNATYRCSTLLKGEEATIARTETTITGCRHQHERRHNLAHKTHVQTLLLLLGITPRIRGSVRRTKVVSCSCGNGDANLRRNF